MMYTSRIYYIVLRIITHIYIIYLGGNMFASVCGCTKHDAYHYVFKIFSIYFVCTNKLFLKSRGRKSVYYILDKNSLLMMKNSLIFKIIIISLIFTIILYIPIYITYIINKPSLLISAYVNPPLCA